MKQKKKSFFDPVYVGGEPYYPCIYISVNDILHVSNTRTLPTIDHNFMKKVSQRTCTKLCANGAYWRALKAAITEALY